MPIEKALVVEDESFTRTFLQETFAKKKCELTTVESGAAALDLIRENSFDLIVTELKTPEITGLEILQTAKKQNPHTVVILITSTQHMETAIQAMRLGAFNYIIKPFSPQSMEAMIDKAQEHISLLQENQFLRREISTEQDWRQKHLIIESDAMKKILADVTKIAKSNSSVFISGESGTGKEVIAHAIHFQSSRANQSFIKVNCAAIPAPLLESEFFGHEKGAFTGAFNKRLGRFELADRGTLLLDEVSEIPLELQPKLLRAVQEMEFERVGGVRPIRVDVRLISTSNRLMKETIEQKLFREDLYYRLNVVPIYLPPLRERPHDIIPLAEFFLKSLCEEGQKGVKTLSIDAKQKLVDYNWPGNIRELANVMERTLVMHPSEKILPEHLHIDLPCSPQITCSFSGLTLKEVEKQLILDTLSQENNNRTKTALVLGISVRTLRNKLNEYSKDI